MSQPSEQESDLAAFVGSNKSQSRSDEVKEFVRDEIERHRHGEVNSLSSLKSISARFGYSSNSNSAVIFHLRNAGLVEERRSIMEAETVTPSQDFAWILGVLSGGHSKGISTSNRPVLANEFKRVGEALLKVNANEFSHTINSKDKTYEMKYVLFPSSRMKRSFGNLRRNGWAKTILDRHEWLLKDEEYIWKFLEGYLEMSGSVQTPGKSRSIEFYTQSVEGANLLVDLLSSVGVERPRLSYLQSDQKNLRGVSIRNLKDINLISEHVHSKANEREEKLASFRGLKLDSLPAVPKSNEDVVSEWIRIRQILGRVPTSKDINILRANGLTKYSHMVYANRFGSGRFTQGKEAIEAILRERGNVEDHPFDIKKKQPKVYIDEEIIQEWKSLTASLGHSPNTKEIERMKKGKLTRFCASLYRDRFGEGSYITARESLERIIAAQEVTEANIEQPAQETQIFPEP